MLAHVELAHLGTALRSPQHRYCLGCHGIFHPCRRSFWRKDCVTNKRPAHEGLWFHPCFMPILASECDESVPPNNYQHKYKEAHSSRHRFNVSADQGIGQNSSHLVDFVTDTNEHERCQDNVEQWLIRNQNQNAFSVMREANLILRYKQLKEKNTTSLNVYALCTQMFHPFYLEIWLYVPRRLKHKMQPF